MATGGDEVPAFDVGSGRGGDRDGDRVRARSGEFDTPAGLPVVTGPQIRAERMRQGWKQIRFAEAVGCSLRALKDIEDPAKAPEPAASSFYGRIIEILKLDQPRQRASAANPDDPPLSQASKLQLARALYRIVSDEEAARRLAGEVEDFDVEGADLIEDPSSRPVSGVVNRSSDSDPPPGTVQS